MEISAADSRADFGGTADRRETSRFSGPGGLRYRVLHAKGLPGSGVGNTLDIGSAESCHDPGKAPAGTLVEVAVNWPVRLVAPATAICSGGQVVRSEATKAAVQIMRYEFKTAGQ